MPIQKKYPSRMRGYSSQNAQNQNSSLAAKNDPRPNVRKGGAVKAQEKTKSSLEVNPDSPLLKEQEDSINLAEKQQLEELKNLRIKSTPKKENPQKSVAKVQQSEEESSAEKVQNEKLDALKQSLQESEEAKKYTHVVIKESENKHVKNDERIPREERLQIASQKNNAHKSAWQWTITLRPAFVFSGMIALFISLAFFFTFGLIVGRGYSPEVDSVALTTITSSNNGANSQASEILKPEDLKYQTALKEQGNPTTPTQVVTGDSSQAAQSESSVVPYPIGANNTSQTTSSTSQTIEPQVNPFEIYEYVLRVASFKNNKSANTLKDRLSKDNIRASVSKAGAWYFVNVSFRGTQDSFDHMREGLKKYSIKDSILMEKDVLQLD